MPVAVAIGQSQVFQTNVVLPTKPTTWMRMTLTDIPLTNYTGRGKFKIGETEDHFVHGPIDII